MRRIFGQLQVIGDFLYKSLILCVTGREKPFFSFLTLHEIRQILLDHRFDLVSRIHSTLAEKSNLRRLLCHHLFFWCLQVSHLVQSGQVAHDPLTAAQLRHGFRLISIFGVNEDLVEVRNALVSGLQRV